MATISLAVSYLTQYEQLISAALPRVVGAFAPFGINLQPTVGYKLAEDPGNSQPGWSNLIHQLTQISFRTNPPTPAHLVVTLIPPGADPTINGQLLERTRGICAVFLGASIFQTPNLVTRIDLVVQVIMHELGHMLGLTHGDDQGAGYPTAMTPTEERLPKSPVQAWKSALADATKRGEPVMIPPNPVSYYPFGTLCRAYLRQASLDEQWLPWRSPFRGNFSLPREKQDQSLSLSVLHPASEVGIHVDDGLALTLEIRNDCVQPVLIPTHIGPEFGTLRVEVRKPDGSAKLFRPSSLRCSSATQAIMPGESVLRSYSFVPHPDDELFAKPGVHVCHLSIIASHGRHPLTLGFIQFDVEVTASNRSKAARRSAAHIVANNGNLQEDLVLARHDRLRTSKSPSPAIAHAKYKLATNVAAANDRIKALTKCIVSTAPIAVRHRAARRLAFERLLSGDSFRTIELFMQRKFDKPEDVELHQTLKRMEDGWKIIQS